MYVAEYFHPSKRTMETQSGGLMQEQNLNLHCRGTLDLFKLFVL